MGKHKKKKKTKKLGLSDKIQHAKKDASKTNPFEIHFNRRKHNVLGQKSKNDRGLPGVSRANALKKRKQTLLVEYKRFGRTNKFTDKRLGEYNPNLSEEDKLMRRFAMERKRHHEKSALFKLDEGEDLTHYGQTLSSLEKFEKSDESDDEVADGKLGEEYTAKAHFGGGTQAEEEPLGNAAKSRKELLDELIAMTKKRKYDLQSEKDSAHEMTEKLDEQLKGVVGLLSLSKKGSEEKQEKKSDVDDFDVIVRQLQFEIKGNPTDRLKTPEEIAKEEKEKLEKLEADRIRRMKGVTLEEMEQKQPHISADDLTDSFVPKKSNKIMLTYKDGVLINQILKKTKLSKRVRFQDEEDISNDDDKSREEESKNSEEKHAELDSDTSETNEQGNTEEENDDSDNIHEEDDSDENMDEDDDESDHFSDIESEEELQDDGKIPSAQQSVVDCRKVEKTIEEAKSELPYTFSAPETYEEFVSLISSHSIDNIVMIVERIRKCTHPSLAAGNKKKLLALFTIILRYCCNTESHACLSSHMLLVDRLVSHLHELAQVNPTEACQVMQNMIAEQQKQLEGPARSQSKCPTIGTLILLRIVPVLYPASDFQHPIITPALLYMAQALTLNIYVTPKAVLTGLFVCSLFLKYVSVSKRFVPEVLNFLHGTLFYAADKKGEIFEVFPPFKPVGENINLLLKAEHDSDGDVTKISVADCACVSSDPFSERQKTKVMYFCLNLLNSFCILYEKQPVFQEAFAPCLKISLKVPWHHYPDVVNQLKNKFIERIEQKSEATRLFLSLAPSKPEPLKLYEPLIEENFDGRKKRKGTKEQNEHQRLLHKLKREKKGAMREVRKDAQFLARERIKEQIEKDQERQANVKRLYAMLSNQEGDYKALLRKKRKA